MSQVYRWNTTSSPLSPVATVLVLRGCLKTGSHILSGTHPAKVRVMTDSSGKSIKAAFPGMAVTVSGWKTLPKAGDEVLDGKESEVKKALANRVRQAEIAASLADVDAINAARKEERERKKTETNKDDTRISAPVEIDGPKELKLIIKADVSGSAEAVEGALQGIGNKNATTRIVSSGVGDVTESDVLMAKAVNGMGFTAPLDLFANQMTMNSHHCRLFCVCVSLGRDFGCAECCIHNRISNYLQVNGRRSIRSDRSTSYNHRDQSDGRSVCPSVVRDSLEGKTSEEDCGLPCGQRNY